MISKRAILGALPPLCVLAVIVATFRMPIPPQNEAADLGPLINETQRTFTPADVTGSIAAPGSLGAGRAFPAVDRSLAVKIPAKGEPRRQHKVAGATGANQNAGYKPDITPPNFTNSAY